VKSEKRSDAQENRNMQVRELWEGRKKRERRKKTYKRIYLKNINYINNYNK